MGYKVLAPYVTLKVNTEFAGTQLLGFYSGAVVPESVDKDSLQHHLDNGLVVKESDPVAEVFAVPAGTPLPDRPPNVPVTEAGASPAQPVPPLTEEQEAAAKEAVKPAKSTARSAKSGN